MCSSIIYPIVGLAMGDARAGFGIDGTTAARQKWSRLILVLVAAASAWPVNVTGQRALQDSAWHDRRRHGLARLHKERAEKAAPAFLRLAVLTAAALVVPQSAPHDPSARHRHALGRGALRDGASGWIARSPAGQSGT